MRAGSCAPPRACRWSGTSRSSALDEAQLGADPERGHVFTDRLLRARGREETMILGSETLRPMIKALVPDAEIVNRPRFSTLELCRREEALAPAQALGDRRVLAPRKSTPSPR